MSRRRVDVPADARAALEALSTLSGKWHPVVVVVLSRRGPMGFNDLLDAVPDVSGKVLSGTLEELGEEGLVERTVLSESPLRVEYRLTDAGRDLEPVFEALSRWGQRHLETGAPTVAIAGANRRLTEMYEEWLTDRYAVVRAHSGDDLKSYLEGGPDVLVFEWDLPGADPEEVVETVDGDCRSIALVDERPSVDPLEIGCDDVLRKPIVRETALEAVAAQVADRSR